MTVGDPAGVGPLVIAQALAEDAHGDADVRVYGDIEALDRAGGVPAGVERRHVATAPVAAGNPSGAAAAGVVEAIRVAARACLGGEHDALVTGPISKEILGKAGFAYPGHTELLEEIAGGGRAVMMLVGGSLRVALATIHCALREVPGRLSTPGLREILRVLRCDLERRFGIPGARIAVCGLNPHAGEGGRFGDEEERVLRPAIEEARAEGVAASGPFSGDSIFVRAVRGEFDAVLAMYHDQGLAPLKVHAFGRAVNVTLGLELIRTSVDHGTAFDAAERGEADAGSMIEAIRLARRLVENERVWREHP